MLQPANWMAGTVPAVVAMLIWAVLAPVTVAPAQDSAVDTAIVFVVDTSQSMDSRERRISRESHAHALTSHEVIDAIRNGQYGRAAFAYVEFARAATVRIDWTVIMDRQSAEELAAEIAALGDDGSPGGSTAIGAGLGAARHLIEDLPWPAGRVVVDVVGDGIENTGFALDTERARLLDMDVVINAMPMLIEPSEHDLDHYFATRVIGGPGAFSIPLHDIENMPVLLRQKMVMELF
jgi:Mg-chelatase subunit ChlD